MNDSGAGPASQPDSALECIICLEEVQDATRPSTCSHTFCRVCIVEWASTSANTCPACRVRFPQLHVLRSGVDELVIEVEDKTTSLEEESEGEIDDSLVCAHCQDPGIRGVLLLCDGCDAAYHLACVGVADDDIPEGDWFCAVCNPPEMAAPRQQTRRRRIQPARPAPTSPQAQANTRTSVPDNGAAAAARALSRRSGRLVRVRQRQRERTEHTQRVMGRGIRREDDESRNDPSGRGDADAERCRDCVNGSLCATCRRLLAVEKLRARELQKQRVARFSALAVKPSTAPSIPANKRAKPFSLAAELAEVGKVRKPVKQKMSRTPLLDARLAAERRAGNSGRSPVITTASPKSRGKRPAQLPIPPPRPPPPPSTHLAFPDDGASAAETTLPTTGSEMTMCSSGVNLPAQAPPPPPPSPPKIAPPPAPPPPRSDLAPPHSAPAPAQVPGASNSKRKAQEAPNHVRREKRRRDMGGEKVGKKNVKKEAAGLVRPILDELYAQKRIARDVYKEVCKEAVHQVSSAVPLPPTKEIRDLISRLINEGGDEGSDEIHP